MMALSERKPDAWAQWYCAIKIKVLFPAQPGAALRVSQRRDLISFVLLVVGLSPEAAKVRITKTCVVTEVDRKNDSSFILQGPRKPEVVMTQMRANSECLVVT